MNLFSRKIFIALMLTLSSLQASINPNQTLDTTPIFPGDRLPFTVQIEQADFSLPSGIQSYVSAVYKGKWLLLAGRTNGLHGFNDPQNFPPSKQNTTVYVVDPLEKTVFSKDLTDPSSGLTQAQIDLLSVTSAQFHQTHHTLYMTGGYGVDSATGQLGTMPSLSAIDLEGIIHWVTHSKAGESAAMYIRQISNPLFQVTGGYMDEGRHGLYLLMFGQNFTGDYNPNTSGAYTQEVRRFRLIDNGKKLKIHVKKSKPTPSDPNYRRRDLNIVPVMREILGAAFPGFVALSGVFTLDTGIWTVPVTIDINGNAHMDNPAKSSTFKQGMNNYVCPTLGLFSKSSGDMFVVLFGGISYGYYNQNGFQTDLEFPFINQVTTIKYDRDGHFKQYLMDAEYPVIPSDFSNIGNTLLFGAGAQFIPANDLPIYDNEVVKLDRLGHRPIVIGYIVGGIASTVPNTSTSADTAASPYIFRVILKVK